MKGTRKMVQKFPSLEKIKAKEIGGCSYNDLLAELPSYWERVCEFAKEKFDEALAAGDESAMDFYHALTCYAEDRVDDENDKLDAAVAIASLINYGVKNGEGSAVSFAEQKYGEPLTARKGFNKVTDVIIEALEECGVLHHESEKNK